ncbi:multidrug resistance protein, MATE family [Pararobbsia alpina]|uniref:MATE family efflux transporter n=1 Tax=Pararobbsia alpina TaxID=621374 RepID=UPI0039A779ED
MNAEHINADTKPSSVPRGGADENVNPMADASHPAHSNTSTANAASAKSALDVGPDTVPATASLAQPQPDASAAGRVSKAPGAKRDLTTGPIGSTLLKFALPTLGSNILQSLNGSVNAAWIGHYLGPAALSAASNANLILFFLLGTVFGIGLAATILVGQAVGARDLTRAKQVVGSGLTFYVVVSLIVALAGYQFTPHILTAMRTPLDARPLAIDYLRVIFIALPFINTLGCATMVLRGAGDARTPFVLMALTVVLDIGLNPLLIFGIGPFHGFGIAGSAIATLTAQVIGIIAMFLLLHHRRHFLLLHPHEFGFLRPTASILRALVFKGVPMGMQLFVVSLAAIAMIGMVNTFGTATTAAYGAVTQLWTYVQMPAVAVGASVSSMVAQNVGARRWDRVSKITRYGVLFSVIMTALPTVVILIFSRGALGLFLGSETEAIRIGMHINEVVIGTFTLFGIMFVLSGAVRATGAVMPPLLLLTFSLWGVRIPFARALLPKYGAEAIWWSFPLGMIVAVTLVGLYYKFGNWRQSKMLDKMPPPPPAPASPVAAEATAPVPTGAAPAGASPAVMTEGR